MKIGTPFDVIARGIGKSDYSRDISRSIQRAGIDLKYRQSLKHFGVVFSTEVSPFAWFKSPLAPGATAHIVDAETGLDTPYTVPQGYIASPIQDTLGFTEDHQIYLDFDTFPVTILSALGGGFEVYRNRVVMPFTTALLDPTGSSSHLFDCRIINKGLGNLEGGYGAAVVLEAVGTEPLRASVKTVRCKHCQHQWEVPVTTTQLTCPQCGKLTIVFNLSSFRGTL